uniref:Hflx-type G domain-containing protein n=1 Tax=Meloidogyne javanica TaxID=6303 RepID=A0A915MVW5_MELJA
ISNNNNSSNVNSRKNTLPPDLPASLAKPAKIPRLNSSIAPLPVVNNNDINLCKGISQQNLESSPSFFTTKPSSRLGLVLHKAEVEGRDYQQKITPKQQQTNETVNNVAQCSFIEKFVRNQDVIAVKWQERNQDREIRDDLTRKIQERDKQIRDRKISAEEKENRKAKKEKRALKKTNKNSADFKREAPDITIINLDSTSNLITPNEGNNNILEGNNTSRKNILSTDLPASIAKPAKIPRLNPSIAPLPAVVNTNIYPSKGIHQQDLESPPSFFTTKPSSRLGLVLHKAEVEGRNYQQKITLQLQQTNDAQSSIGENFVSNKDGISSVKRYEYNQDRELREDLTRKIQERDKQIRDRTESRCNFINCRVLCVAIYLGSLGLQGEKRIQGYFSTVKIREIRPQPEIKKLLTQEELEEQQFTELKLALGMLNGNKVFGSEQILLVHPHVRWGSGSAPKNATPELQVEEALTLCQTIPGFKVSELTNYFGLPIYDRLTIVLSIFKIFAKTKEAKLQIALAEIPFIRSHIRFLNKSGEHLSDNKTLISSSAPMFPTIERLEGTKQLEFLRLREHKIRKQINNSIELTKRELFENKEKLGPGKTPVIGIIGYTNSGKTTFIKRLTDSSSLLGENRLFATLDSTTHLSTLPSSIKVIFADTIGFISNLPIKLLASFSATLQHVESARFIA